MPSFLARSEAIRVRSASREDRVGLPARCSGGIFRDAYHFSRPVDEVIREIDPNAIIAYVPGCPPKPEAMISGAVKALSTL